MGDVEVGAEGEAFAFGVGGVGQGEDERACGDEYVFGVHHVVAFAAAHHDAEGFEGGAFENFTKRFRGHGENILRIGGRVEENGFVCGGGMSS